MNKKGAMGLLAAILFMGGGIRLSSQAERNGESVPQTGAQPPAAHTGAPDARDGPWWAACDFFKGAPPRTAAPTGPSVDPRWRCVPANANVRFLIATVPDPKRTHLALYFDRSIESIIAAAEDTGYQLEQFWIPWSTQADPDLPLLHDREQHENDLANRYDKPGLLVFRGAPSRPVLFVFLAGETPTTGVDEDALTAAVGVIHFLGGSQFSIAGPTYSGSLEALCDQLERWGGGNVPGAITPLFRLASGTVTLNGAKKMVEDRLGKGSYNPLVHDDERARELFFAYVESEWHSPNKTALISELGTAYRQRPPEDDKNDPGADLLYINYPREIARLRNAYQEETDAAPGNKPQSVVAEGVKLTLKDGIEQPAEDRIAAFSPLQSPASQQAVLAGIGATLRREHVELAGVVATDILDSAFLDRYLRLSAPDTRLFMLDADVLLSREVETEPLTGLLSVTTYPLLGRAQHWMRKYDPQRLESHESRIQFSSGYAEGVYNSVRFLLYEGAEQETVLRDYARPFWSVAQSDPRPPVWLMVLGRDGYWPVALLDESCPDGIVMAGECKKDQDSSLLASLEKEQLMVEPALHPESPSFGWYLGFWALFVWGALHCIYWEITRAIAKSGATASSRATASERQKAGNEADHDASGQTLELVATDQSANIQEGLASNSPGPRWRTFTARISKIPYKDFQGVLAEYVFPAYPAHWPERTESAGNERPFLAAATLAIFSAIVLFAVAGLRFYQSMWWMYIYGALSLIVLAELFRVACLFTRTSGLSYIITVQGWLLAAVFSFAWILWCWKPTYASGYFFSYRSLSLTSGVSPVLPVFSLMAATYCWAWVQLKRQVEVNKRREYDKQVEAAWQGELSSARNSPEELAFTREFERAVSIRDHYTGKIVDALNDFGSSQVRLQAGVFLALWLILFQPWRHAVSFEHYTFNWFYTWLLSEVFWMMSLCWIQFLRSWHRFKDFLVWLENQPVRRAFSRLQGKVAWVPLVAKMPSQLLLISVRCRDCLQALMSFPGRTLPAARAKDLQQLLSRLSPLHQGIAEGLENIQKRPGNPDDDEYVRLQAKFETARLWITHDLREHSWTRGSSESLPSPTEQNASDATLPTAEEKLTILEEEFIALRTLMFMRFVYRQLRYLLGFVVTAFILFVVSLNVYPFQAHRWNGFALVFTFLALAASAVMVFAQMDRDPILSRITKTEANVLNKTFFLRTAQFSALPLLALLASQFPSINHYIFFWAQPALEALR